MNIEEAIVVANVLEKEWCEFFIENSKSWEWHKGTWFDYAKNMDKLEEGERSEANYTSSMADEKFQMIMRDAIMKGIKVYNEKVPLFQNGVDLVNHMRVNKYEVGNDIHKHRDHIHSIFDGKLKGIPVLSFVGLLNDDFEGGDFVFFDDYKVELKSGDVVMFPSCFLYPHQVTEITKGTRYSFVTWAW